MRRDVVFSLILHALIISATLWSAPIKWRKEITYDDIIRVQLTAPAEITSSEPVALEPVEVPAPVIEEAPDIPITSPTTVEEAEIPEKPKPKPEKPKPKPKPEVTKKPSDQSNTGNTGENKGQEISTPGGFGSPFAGATIDNASFNYPYWFTQAFNKIAVNWNNPVVYDGTLICTIYFQVIKSGRIIEMRIEKSSGIPEFDESCLRAVSGAAPFPPLPRQFRDEIIGLTLPFKHSPR
ncbi:MAG: TonB family protein [candidate division Zixibacteria bacterium]|nr:TonB family protein [candidate division Zixibacteria bacterium]